MKDKIKPIGYLIVVLVIGVIIGYLIAGSGQGNLSGQVNLSGQGNPSGQDVDKNFLITLANQSIIASDWCVSLGGYWYGEPQAAEIPIQAEVANNYKQIGFNVIEKEGQKYIQAISIDRYCILPAK